MSNLLKNGHILLVSSQTSHRSGLRKTLCDLGADNKNIEVAADFNQAKERLSHGTINLIISDDEIGEKESGIDLIELHEKNNPVSRTRIFILMTSQASPFLMADFTLRGGDTLISKPFKNDTFIKSLQASLLEKDNVSVEEGTLWDIQDAIRGENIDKALELITTFKNATSVEANLSRAIIYQAKKDLDLAYEMYDKVLTKKVNFKALVNILKIGAASKKYEELLKYIEIWLKNFPLHHDSLPDITRVIIANKKFGLLDELFDLFSQHKTEDQFAKIPLAAGFVMASRNHLENSQNDKAKSYALKGVEYSCSKFQIMSRALEILMILGAKEEAERAYTESLADLNTNEEKIFDLRLKSIIYPRPKVLIDCQKLLSEKIVDPDLYQITITCLKEIGKDPEEIIGLARRHYPNLELKA